jgi:hypothetical protein
MGKVVKEQEEEEEYKKVELISLAASLRCVHKHIHSLARTANRERERNR